jgi:F-type H+-transporting ATPase subunit b
MSAVLQSAEFWVLIAFIILVGAVAKKVWAAMTAGLDARAGRIKSHLDEAEKLREDAQSLLAEYQASSPRPRPRPSASANRPKRTWSRRSSGANSRLSRRSPRPRRRRSARCAIRR